MQLKGAYIGCHNTAGKILLKALIIITIGHGLSASAMGPRALAAAKGGNTIPGSQTNRAKPITVGHTGQLGSQAPRMVAPMAAITQNHRGRASGLAASLASHGSPNMIISPAGGS